MAAQKGEPAPTFETWPISRYIGEFPKGQWGFVEEFSGSEEKFRQRIDELQKGDPEALYRLWDCR
jgi:hypothetical protein